MRNLTVLAALVVGLTFCGTAKAQGFGGPQVCTGPNCPGCAQAAAAPAPTYSYAPSGVAYNSAPCGQCGTASKFRRPVIRYAVRTGIRLAFRHRCR